MYIQCILLLCHDHIQPVHVIYVIKENTVFWGGLNQLMAVVGNRMRVQALQTSRKKAACSLS